MNISTILEAIEEELGFSFVFKDEVHREVILNKLCSAAQAIYRRELVKEACGLGLSLYGDGWWGGFREMGADYGGWIDNRTDLPKLYNASKINLNICLGKTAPNLRFFEILACGGFLLTNYLDDLEKLFELDKEIVCYRDAKELREKAKYYLAHPKEREEIARRGHERVLREHTYKNRMKEMIDILKGII